jgi:hypothetical protein
MFNANDWLARFVDRNPGTTFFIMFVLIVLSSYE